MPKTTHENPKPPLADTPGSADLVRLPNDTKIRFCNAMHALTQHTYVCTPCTLYTERGDGDLCETGKDIIARELCYSETHVEFPPNKEVSDEPRKPKT